MISRFVYVKQGMVLAGLALALLVAGAAPLLGGHTVDAARKGKRATTKDVNTELVRGFANNNGIAIRDNEPATPYPSTITVSGLETEVAHVAVTLHQFSHTAPDQLKVLLVGPGGQTAIILADVGGLNPANSLTLTLDDRAASPLPRLTALSSGTFQPTNHPGTTDTFPAPAPSPLSANSALFAFTGTNPNGAWSLFVVDRGVGDSGSIGGGWSMVITTANGTPKASPDSFQAKAGKTLRVSAAGVLENDRDPDGDLLSAVVAGQPKRGTLSLQPDGSFTYKARKKAKGTDSFTYLAQDPGGLTGLATVDIKIKGKKKRKR